MTDREILELLLQKVTTIEKDVAELKTDVAELKTDVAELKIVVTKLKRAVSTLETNYMTLSEKVDIILEQTASLTEFREETRIRLNQLTEEQKSIREIIAEHMISIRTLERKIG
ncbi:MAG: hypothetical protein WD469_12600 [Paenibacillaceae bacterium]